MVMEQYSTFFNNIGLFLNNSDRILADARMAFCPVPVKNGLAYTGSLSPATLGGYLDWWINCPDVSHDRQGRPIWFISGSPLSGCQACQCVDTTGQTVKAETPLRVNIIARTFTQSQRKYQILPSQCIPYTLHDVIEMLSASE